MQLNTVLHSSDGRGLGLLPKLDRLFTPSMPNETSSNLSVIPATNAEVVSPLSNTVQNLATMLADAVNSMTTLTVTTSTSEDINNGTAIKLQAKTIIKLDGDMEIIIPRAAQTNEDGTVSAGIDDRLWAIHSEMVEAAQSKRLEFIQMVADVATTLLSLRR